MELVPLTPDYPLNMLKKVVEEHRAGADPNDDLTMMCIRLSN